jgi:hypothetical protein
MIVAGSTVVVVAAAVAVYAAASGSTDQQADRSSATAGATPAATGAGSLGAAPKPTALPANEAELLGYVAALPTVRDVDASTVDEYSGLVCESLRSPKMSPAFFTRIVTIEQKGYSLDSAQAIGLLTATARYGCPDALGVIHTRGALPGSSG